MGLKIIVIAALSLVVLACGKSDEGTEATDTINNVSAEQVAAVTETPAAAEAVKVAEEPVAVSETATQVLEQADGEGSGEAVYKKSCMSCHMTGAAGAPKVGDVPAWEPRIAKGAAVLVQSAITGVPGTAMMARGTCGACSDDDIMAAVEYMIAQSR